MATVCCNACRACVTNNIVALGVAALVAVGTAIAGLARRVVAKPS